MSSLIERMCIGLCFLASLGATVGLLSGAGSLALGCLGFVMVTSLALLVTRKPLQKNFQQTILNNLHEAVVVMDRSGHLIETNPAAAKLFGTTTSDIKNNQLDDPRWKSIREDGTVLEQHELPLAITLQTGRIHRDFIFGLYNPDGTLHWLSVNTDILTIGVDNKPETVLATITDITAQKRANDELRSNTIRTQELNAFQRAILQAADVAIIATDTDLHIRNANPAAERMFGHTGDSMLGKSPAHLIDLQQLHDLPEGHNPTERLKALILTGNTVEHEWTCIHSNKTRHPVRVTLHPLLGDYKQQGDNKQSGDDKHVIGYLIIGTDLWERKRLEDQLERFFSMSLELLCIADKNGIFIRTNPAWTMHLGWSADQLHGRSLLSFVHPDDQQATREEMEALQGGGYRLGFNHRFQHVDGSWRSLRWSAASDPASGIVIGAAHDVSAEVEAQAVLRRAKDQAEHTAQAKSDFLATMSHEIRTPLNGIIGMSGLMMDTTLTVKQRDYLETVRSCSNGLLTLINDILDFSKIDAGRLELESLNFDLRIVVEDVVSLITERAQAKGLELSVRIDNDVPHALHGDPARLRQILLNLLSNSVKFTERGEVRISVERDREDGREHEDAALYDDKELGLRFIIADTGIGMTPAVVKNLFQPFMQADATTTRRFGGTGLGLAITKRLCLLMGGTIQVTSTAQSGSTFTCRLPFLPRPQSSNTLVAAPELANSRVLVIDHHEHSRHNICDILLSWGIEVDEAENGSEALLLMRASVASRRPYHLVLVDLAICDQPAREFLRTLADDPQYHRTIRVATTTQAGRINDDELATWHVADCLTRPIRQEPLYHTLIQHILGRERPTSGERPAVHSLDTHARILIAEDNQVNQRVALALCARMGLHADAASDGLEAIQALARAPYDLILMDCQMPEMDGFQATKEIRRRERDLNTHIPIIALTANAMQGDRERCLQAGMDDYLSKPIRAEDLYACLSLWIPSTDPVQTPSVAHLLEKTPLSALHPAEDTPMSDLPNTSDDFNPQVLTQLADELGPDALEVVRDILAQFLADAPQGLRAVEAAATAHDAKALMSSAHRLKGQALTLGCTTVGKTCNVIEQAGKMGDVATAVQAAGELGAQLERAEICLRQHVQALGTP